jgi:hypothetical protein
MRVIATTARRRSVMGKEPTGRILDIDFSKKKIEKAMPVPDPVDPFSYPNPRGGPRGGRGARVLKDTILITTYDSIYRYSLDWEPQGVISHPLASDLHEIWAVGDGIWAAASGIDALLKFDLKGRLTYRWSFREDATVMGGLHFGLPPIGNWSVDYRRFRDNAHDCGHLNSVVEEGDRLIVTLGFLEDRYGKRRKAQKRGDAKPAKSMFDDLYNRYLHERLERSRTYKRFKLRGVDTECMILELDPRNRRSRIMHRSPAWMPDHNGVPWDSERMLLNKTSLMELFVIDRATGEVTARVKLPGTHLRGLARVDDERVPRGHPPDRHREGPGHGPHAVERGPLRGRARPLPCRRLRTVSPCA